MSSGIIAALFWVGRHEVILTILSVIEMTASSSNGTQIGITPLSLEATTYLAKARKSTERKLIRSPVSSSGRVICQ